MCIKVYKAAPITSVLDLKTGLALGAVKATSDDLVLRIKPCQWKNMVTSLLPHTAAQVLCYLSGVNESGACTIATSYSLLVNLSLRFSIYVICISIRKEQTMCINSTCYGNFLLAHPFLCDVKHP